MKVHSSRDGRVTAVFDDSERKMLADLATQLAELLDSRELGDPHSKDPAIVRLLPDAYRDDPEAADEFRRFTESELATLKSEGAAELARAASASRKITLDEHQLVPWLRTITDLRLALAVRLGIERDGDPGDQSAAAVPTRAAYRWLGELQERLLAALAR